MFKYGLALIGLGLAMSTAHADSTELSKVSRDSQIQNLRDPGKKGLNTFEAPKDSDSDFDGLDVQVGGAFALQFQALGHENESTNPDNTLAELGDNFNLATANLDLNVQLAKGVRMATRTYLSSRHHAEAWVKDGYLQVDSLDFIQSGFMSDVMKYTQLKVGHMEVNYGDYHFRRTDNASALQNPFVGNYLMDSFTTEVGGEALFRYKGFLAMVGMTNGKLNQDVLSPGMTDPSFVGKVGYDSQINDDLRVRLTGSMYATDKAKRIYLYSGDRTGSRYYSVMAAASAEGDNFRSGRFNPGFSSKLQAFMINPFVKWKGLEFFGTVEFASGDSSASEDTRTWTQLAGDLTYRFGWDENLFTGVRYNRISGKLEASDAKEVAVERIQAALGWFLTENVVLKMEYVNNRYLDFPEDDLLSAGKFEGFMLESSIAI